MYIIKFPSSSGDAGEMSKQRARRINKTRENEKMPYLNRFPRMEEVNSLLSINSAKI